MLGALTAPVDRTAGAVLITIHVVETEIDTGYRGHNNYQQALIVVSMSQ
jgi:hypothetical protein